MNHKVQGPDQSSVMHFAFLMDPLKTVKAETDTSFAFMRGAQNRGHRVSYCSKQGISFVNGQVMMNLQNLEIVEEESFPFIVQEENLCPANELDAIFVRSDPPFDQTYLEHTWLLDLVSEKVVIVNSPRGLRTVNEKIWVSQFSDFTPKTCITSQKSNYESFLEEHSKVVVKPTDGHGGKGVFIVNAEDSNASVIFETLSAGETKNVIVQEFIADADAGDKRVLVLGDQILGAVNRVHREGEHRNNFYAGGRAESIEVTEHEREVVQVLAPHLKALGLHFVGLDFLGDRLVEVNVTSPTCLQEMNRLYNKVLEADVIQYVEALSGTLND